VIRVLARHPRIEFAVVGRGAPPAVTLEGPRGLKLASSESPEIRASHGDLIVSSTGSDTTYFIVDRPRAGRWRLTPAAGSPQVVRYALADPQQPLRIHAKVTGVGAHRILAWRFTRQRRVTVRFTQIGGTAQTFLTAGAGHGHTGFAVAPGPGGTRTIVATILVDDLPEKV
jgi:hypothetical protein